jgi:hypothetical protein
MRAAERALAWSQKMAVAVLLLACAAKAHADPETFVTVLCDQERGELGIHEYHEDKDVAYPAVIGPKDMEFAVSGLMSMREVSGEIVREDLPISRECRLGSNVYVATFSAYSSGGSIQGYCGGNPPTVSITLSRNRKVIFSNLVLNEGCEATQVIERVRVLDIAQVVVATVLQRSVDAAREPLVARMPVSDTITSEAIFLAAAPRAAP